MGVLLVELWQFYWWKYRYSLKRGALLLYGSRGNLAKSLIKTWQNRYSPLNKKIYASRRYLAHACLSAPNSVHLIKNKWR